MIQLSKFPINTLKSQPKVSDNRSTSLLLQWGLIRQEMAWVYNYLPLWFKVLKKIENIVREEMNSSGAFEMLMPALGSKEHWVQTGRWDTIDVLFKVPASGDKEYALNPTQEDIVTPLIKDFIQSYKDLEFGVYHIQHKFRNEARAKSWLLRGREFLMKDLYSFHKNEDTFQVYYDNQKEVYTRVFERLGLGNDTYMTLASGWDFTDKHSHEFQTVLEIGEDIIYICDDCDTSHNEEIVGDSFACSACGSNNHKTHKASEVGNIFPLSTKFTDACGVKYTDENGKEQPVFMGSYGIGISRAMWVMAEYFMDETGIAWPENVAPATHYIIVLWDDNIEKASDLAKQIESDWGDVILDDRMGRKDWFGQKMWDAELLWIPNIIVISPKTLEKWGYEIRKRWDKEGSIVKL